MTNILRSLSFNIDQFLYPLIPSLYQIFYDIASQKYFTAEAINKLANNIYIILSVCMLFALGLKLISAIVNPEWLIKEKKGVKSVFLHCVFAVFLIILIPIGFQYLYQIQEDVLDNQLVEKIVLGVEADDSSDPGQILAAYTFGSFVFPNENGVSCAELTTAGGDYYNSALQNDINDIDKFETCVNATTNGEYDLTFHALLSPGAALFMIYELILLCIDTALRTIKLGLLQLIAPVVLCGYVIVGSEILMNWLKEVGRTFTLIFLKVAAMSFMVYGLSMLPDFISNLPSRNFWYNGFIRLFIIIGLFQVIHHVPDIINAIFGTHIQSRGGIRGRLGEMAAVGNLAQRGWDQLRTHPIQTTQRLVAAPVSAVGGAVAHNVAALNRAKGMVWDSDRHRFRPEALSLRTWGNAAGAVAGGALTTLGAAYRGGRHGFQNRNLQGIGYQGRRYEDTHKSGSTLMGRLHDDFRDFMGIESRNAIFARNAEKAGKASNSLHSAYQSGSQMFESEHCIVDFGSQEFNENGVNAIDEGLRAAGMTAAQMTTLHNMFDGHNSNQVRQMIDDYRQSAPQRDSFFERDANGNYVLDANGNRIFDQDAYDDAFANYNERLRLMETASRIFSSEGSRLVLNAASGMTPDLGGFMDGTVEGQEAASYILNTITSQIGEYGANRNIEGRANLAGIPEGALGNNLQALINDANNVIVENSQQYDARGEITNVGEAFADNASRQNRTAPNDYESINNQNRDKNNNGGLK